MNVRTVSGNQYALRCGAYLAEIASIGATLRSLSVGGRDLIVPFSADQERPSMRGALLAPWPNRTADGRYQFNGDIHQLEVNETETRSALHGLIAWQDFEEVEITSEHLRLATTIDPQAGYPWSVRIQVDFTLTANGLAEEITATNLSKTTAPFGLGGHPYLLAGDPGPNAISSWRLELQAATVLLICPDRLLPTETVSVYGDVDFRSGRVIGDTQLNHAFTGLARTSDGLACVRVSNDDGTGAEVEWDARCAWVQIYTSDSAGGAEYRHAIAVEPMTCPPDAMNSKWNLLSIPPGGSVSAGWVIRSVG